MAPIHQVEGVLSQQNVLNVKTKSYLDQIHTKLSDFRQTNDNDLHNVAFPSLSAALKPSRGY